MVTLGSCLICNMGGFEHARKKWLLKPKADQLWLNFKTLFDEAWVDLCKLHEPRIKDTTLKKKMNLIWKEVIEVI